MPKRSLLEYLEERLGEPATFPRNGETSWHCPMCLDRTGDESHERKFGINLLKRKAHCFRCGYSAHELYRFFMDLNGGRISVEEIDLLRGEAKVVEARQVRAEVLSILYGEEEAKAPEILKPVALPPHCIRLTESQKNPKAERAFQYLARRGVDRARIRRHDIRFCPRGPWAGHLIFPVYQNGEMVYWTTRTIKAGVKNKSKNPRNVEGYYTRAHCLLNYDNCIGEPLVGLGEGSFDMMAFPAAVASLGKVLSEMQIRLIETLCSHGTKEIVIALDAGEGQQADRYYQALIGRVPKVSQLVLDYGDPADRRGDMERLLAERREPSVVDRVKARLVYGK